LPGPTSSQLANELLSVSDLPAGWTSTPVNPSSSGTFCRFAANLKSLASGHAEADFANGNFPVFDELIAGYSSPPTQVLAKAVSELDGCTTFKAEGGTFTLGRMSLPQLGTASAAYQANGTVKGFNLGLDLVFVQKGNRILGVFYGDLGTPDVAQVESFARLAAARLP
jgi:hypothetical protein